MSDQDIVQLPHQYIAHLEGEDLKHAIERNFKEVAHMLYILQMYEKKIGKPINGKVDGVIDGNGYLITGMLSEKMVGLQNELKLADAAVTAAKLAVAAVVAEKIKDGEISADKIAANAVTAVKIDAGAVSADKIAANAVTADKVNVENLAAISAYLGKIVSGQIYSTTIQSGAEEATSYIKLASGDEPLLIVRNGKNALSIWSASTGGFVQFYDPDVDAMRGQILPHDDADGVGLRVQARSSSSTNYSLSLQGQAGIEMHGDVWANDDLTVMGDLRAYGSKPAIMPTESYGQRLLYCMEMPEVKFMDEGVAELRNGIYRVDLDPIFAETIEPNTAGTPFIVHLTPYDWLNLRVAEIGDSYFIVEEKDGLDGKFSWQLSATRRGFAGERLARVDDEDVLTSNWEDDLLEFAG